MMRSPSGRACFLAVLTVLAVGCTEPSSAPNSRRAATESGPAFSAVASSFTFATLDPPGSVSTWPMAIGGNGDVVGFYTDAAQVSHGFVFSNDSYTTIDYPGAAYTEARGIGPNGDIVGAYRNAGEPSVNYHGFLRTPDGTFVPVNYPGHTSTIPQRVLPNGAMIGCYHDGDLAGSMHAVVMDRHGNQASTLFASMHDGATPDLHRITGRYMDPVTGENRGYLLENGVLTSLMVPTSTLTQAWDMNPSGVIVGLYRDAVGFHGFSLSGGSYTPINVPGATQTRAFGINASGDVVGSYVSGAQAHGFIATRVGSSEYSAWTAPRNAGAPINSTYDEHNPFLSGDGLTLYFASTRPGGKGTWDIWVAHRASVDADWEPPVNLPAAINTAAVELGPVLSRDGHQLYFSSTRPGGSGALDLWVSWRADVNDDAAWEPPVNLGADINGPGQEWPLALRRPEMYVSKSLTPTGDFHIFVSRMRGDRLDTPVPVAELNSGYQDRAPSISADGREFFLTSTRPGGSGDYDLWTSTRDGDGRPWSAPVNLGGIVNSPYLDVAGRLSDDGLTLFFVSNRPGGLGGQDIYYSMRTRKSTP